MSTLSTTIIPSDCEILLRVGHEPPQPPSFLAVGPNNPRSSRLNPSCTNFAVKCPVAKPVVGNPQLLSKVWQPPFAALELFTADRPPGETAATQELTHRCRRVALLGSWRPIPLSSELGRQFLDRQAFPTQLHDPIHHPIVFTQRLVPGNRPDNLVTRGLATSPRNRNSGAFGVSANIDHDALGEKPYDLLAIHRRRLGRVPECRNVGGNRQDPTAILLREPSRLFI